MLWRRLIKVVMNLREFIIILDRNGNILLIRHSSVFQTMTLAACLLSAAQLEAILFDALLRQSVYI
jgi:hypothetical protein